MKPSRKRSFLLTNPRKVQKEDLLNKQYDDRSLPLSEWEPVTVDSEKV